MDASGNTNFQTVGTTQLLSVPYALYAKNSGSNLHDNDTSATNELQTLSINGSTLSISNGNSVNLPAGGNYNPADNIKQQIPVYGLFFNPETITSMTATTDGNILFIVIRAYSGGNPSAASHYLVRLERDVAGTYYPSYFSGVLNPRPTNMTVIDTFLYVHFTTSQGVSTVKRAGVSGGMNFTDMTFNPSIPTNIGALFTDGTNLFIQQNNEYATYQIISTALINTNNNFSFTHNGSTSGFGRVIFDGTHYIIYRSANPNYYLLKYDLNRNFVTERQISSASSNQQHIVANASSSKLVLAEVAIGSGFPSTTTAIERMPIIITSPIDKP